MIKELEYGYAKSVVHYELLVSATNCPATDEESRRILVVEHKTGNHRLIDWDYKCNDLDDVVEVTLFKELNLIPIHKVALLTESVGFIYHHIDPTTSESNYKKLVEWLKSVDQSEEIQAIVALNKHYLIRPI